MSFYGRHNGFRGFGFSETVQQLIDEHSALAVQGRAAVAGSADADAAVAASNARLLSAKADSAQLEKLDADWFIWISTNAPAGSDPNRLYQKYRYSFPEQDPAYDPNGLDRDFNAGSDLLEQDKDNAALEIKAATGALAAAKTAAAKAKSELDRLTTAATAAMKKRDDAVKAEEKAAAQSVVNDAKAKANAATEARVLKTLNEAKLSSPKAEGPSPLVIAAIAVPVLGAVVWALTRKKTAVAGYRRRSRR